MSLQDYYDEFRSCQWADPDPEQCLCRGSGYALSDVDTWHECPYHYRKGQPHPEYGCLECGNGENYPPADCPWCGGDIIRDLHQDD